MMMEPIHPRGAGTPPEATWTVPPYKSGQIGGNGLLVGMIIGGALVYLFLKSKR